MLSKRPSRDDGQEERTPSVDEAFQRNTPDPELKRRGHEPTPHRVAAHPVKALRSSPKALLCAIPETSVTMPGGKKKVYPARRVWIPHSRVHADSEVFALGHEGVLVVTKWMADKEGLP